MKISLKNDEMNHASRLAIDGDVWYSLFYNSYDKKRHIRGYIPYKRTPGEPLCKGLVINCSPTRSNQNICSECMMELLRKCQGNDE